LDADDLTISATEVMKVKYAVAYLDATSRPVFYFDLESTSTTGVGSQALGRVHDGVRLDLIKADVRQLAATLNAQLIRPLIDLNFGPQQAYPYFKIELPDTTDRELETKILKGLVDAGYTRIPLWWIRDKFSLPEPEEVPEAAVEPEEEDELRDLMRGALQFTGNKLVNNMHNVRVLARIDDDLRDALGWDRFQHRLVALRDIGPAGIREGDVIDAKLWPRLISMVQGAEPARAGLKSGEIKVGLAMEAEWDRGFNPLQDYLNNQSWDGASRIETLIARTLCAETDEITIEMVKRWLVQAVDRAFNPRAQGAGERAHQGLPHRAR